MYHRAIKIARVLEESRKERQALAMGKRKMELVRKGFSSNKRFRPNNYQGKGKGLMEGRLIPSVRHVVDTTWEDVTWRFGVSCVESRVI